MCNLDAALSIGAETLATKKPKFDVGTKVKLREDVLLQHSKSVPDHAGFTTEQFSWRETLDNLAGKVGTIDRVFDSKHRNVRFEGGELIGIDYTQLVEVV